MTRREGVWLLALALVVRVVFFHGFVGADDVAYLTEAQSLLGLERSWELHPHNQRHGMVVPTALLLLLGRGSFHALSLFPLLASLAGVLLARDLGERLTGDAAVGRAGAVFLALLPIDVVFASQLYPDLPASVGVAASFWVLTRRPSARGALAAGLLMGWALLCKETMVVFLPFLLGWTWRRQPRRLLPWLVGAAVLPAIDMVAAFVATGNAWFHLDAVRHGSHASVHYRPLGAWMDVPARLFVQFPALLLDPRNPSILQYGFLGYAALGGALAVLLSRARQLTPLVWLLSGYAVYLLWPASLTPYIPAVPVQQRTLALLSIPLCLVAAQGWVALADRAGRGVRIAAGAALLGSGLAGSALYGLQYRGATDNAAAFVSWWEEARRNAQLDDSATVVYTDSTNRLILPFLRHFRSLPTVTAFPADRTELADGALAFIDEKRIGFPGDEDPRVLPEYVRNPPANWVLLNRFEAQPTRFQSVVGRVLKPWLPADRAERLFRREPAAAYRIVEPPAADSGGSGSAP